MQAIQAFNTMKTVIPSNNVTVELEVISPEDKEAPKSFSCGVGRELVLGRASKTAGEAPSSDNALFRNQVLSRRHAILIWQPNGHVSIHDNKSTHGTFLNRAGVQSALFSEPIRLQHDDILTFGKTINRPNESKIPIFYHPLVLRVSIRRDERYSASAKNKYALETQEQLFTDEEEGLIDEETADTPPYVPRAAAADKQAVVMGLGSDGSTQIDNNKTTSSTGSSQEINARLDHFRQLMKNKAQPFEDGRKTSATRAPKRPTPILISESDSSSVRASSPAPLPSPSALEETQHPGGSSGNSSSNPAAIPSSLAEERAAAQDQDTVESDMEEDAVNQIEETEQEMKEAAEVIRDIAEFMAASTLPNSPAATSSDVDNGFASSPAAADSEDESEAGASGMEEDETDDELDEEEVDSEDGLDKPVTFQPRRFDLFSEEEEEEDEKDESEGDEDENNEDEEEEEEVSEASSQIFDTSPQKVSSPELARLTSVSSDFSEVEPAHKKAHVDGSNSKEIEYLPTLDGLLDENGFPMVRVRSGGRILPGFITASSLFRQASEDLPVVHTLEAKKTKKPMRDASVQVEMPAQSSMAVQTVIECKDVEMQCEGQAEGLTEIERPATTRKRTHEVMVETDLYESIPTEDTEEEMHNGVPGISDPARPKKGLPWRAAAKYTSVFALGAVAAVVGLAAIPELD